MMSAPAHSHCSPTPTISVIITSYNSRRTIDMCLNSLRPTMDQPPAEIILVENSLDGTEAHVRSQFPFVRLIHLPERVFLGKGRNIGAKAASGSILAFTDADCVVAPDWLDAICRSFVEHPDQDACAGCIENHNPHSAASWVSFLTEFNGYIGRVRRHPTRHLPGYSIACRRSVFEEVGGFPEDVAGLEDMLLTTKWLGRGARLFIEPTIRVAHHNRERLRDFFRHQRKLGRDFALSRFRADMPGARALRATAMSIPVLALWRMARAFERTFRGGVYLGLLLVALSPLYILGMVVWASGVWAGRRDCVRDLRKTV